MGEEGFMGRRVLVTGGAGFIGSAIAERLLAAGHEVAVLDNLSTGKREQVPAKALFLELDITRPVDSAFERFRPEVVVHQAAQVSVPVSIRQPELDARTNILGSINVIEASRRHGVKKVVYASSAAAYGPLDTLPLREEMRPQPVSCYGASKYAVEHYLRTAGREWGLEWAALRYANVYGPRQDPHGEAGVVAIFSQLLLEGKSPTIFGDGELTRDYVYVEDVAAANLQVLEADLRGHPDPVFNVSTGVATSVNRLFERLQRALGSSVSAVHGPPRPGDVRHSLLDSAKLRSLLGWKPAVKLEEGLERTGEFLLRRQRQAGKLARPS
jgi:UDP-glucose 4-epimerase